jgi:CRP-like cAMP-binding protein
MGGEGASHGSDNLLLAALPPEERRLLARGATAADIALGEEIQRPNAAIGHILFPETGVLSLMSMMRAGQAVEIATIGREGLAGIGAAFGPPLVTYSTVVQVPGRFVHVPEATVRAALGSAPSLRALVFRYGQVLMSQIAQSVACNQLHSTQQRYCRWLLAMQDRAGRPVFQITQEFMATLLGVRRQTVSEIAAELQRHCMVEYTRGSMRILDRRRLRACTCECYDLVARLYRRLYGMAGRGAAD